MFSTGTRVCIMDCEDDPKYNDHEGYIIGKSRDWSRAWDVRVADLGVVAVYEDEMIPLPAKGKRK